MEESTVVYAHLKDGYSGLTEPGLAAVLDVLTRLGVAIRDLKDVGNLGVSRLTIPQGKFKELQVALGEPPCSEVVELISTTPRKAAKPAKR